MTTPSQAPNDGVPSPHTSLLPDTAPAPPAAVPPPPPPDVDPVTLRLVELQSTISRLSPDELREHLTKNPDGLALLVDGLHQTGGPGSSNC